MTASLPDTQSIEDHRKIKINQVGIKSYAYPVLFQEKGVFSQHSVGNFDMFVELPAIQKGTHMSRFIEILNEDDEITVDYDNMLALCKKTQGKLDSIRAFVAVEFPFFLKKRAPVTEVASLLDYRCKYCVETGGGAADVLEIALSIPVTSLCPCSKSISNYGAHNQRSKIDIVMKLCGAVDILEIITEVEQSSSSELYGVLKREDEKHVTERAYNNPQFVEDMVRNTVILLEKYDHIVSFEVHVENFESIHNHSAYAMVKRG